MKTILLMLGVLASLIMSLPAQTNAIIFPQLLSPTNSILMMDAEFRCFSGNKIFFKNDAGYKSFFAADLNTNVLNALNTTAAKLDANQEAVAAANLRYKVQNAARIAEQAAQQRAQAVREEQETLRLEKQAIKAAMAEPRPTKVIVEQGYRQRELNYQQKIGAYSP